MYDVIIPALNEEATIGPIVYAFKHHPAINNVIVVIDDKTTDATADMASFAYRAIIVWGPQGGGKGQNIQRGLLEVVTPRVILCDGDIQGLSPSHIDTLVKDDMPFVIGVPDFPLTEVLISPKMTWEWLPRVFETYAWVSGERVVSAAMLRNVQSHGYLNEVQINAEYAKVYIKPTFRHLRGLYSPFKFSDARMKALQDDREWGIQHGVFGR